MDFRPLITLLRKITVPGPRSPMILLLGVLQRFWQRRLTRSGRFLLGGSVLTIFAGAFPQAVVGTLILAAITSLILISLLATAWRLPRISVSRTLGERLYVNTPVTMNIDVVNTSRHTLLDVGATEFNLPPSFKMLDAVQYTPHLDPGASKSFTYNFTAEKRGLYQLAGPSLLSAFPFGLAQSRMSYKQPQKVIVCPQFHPLRRMNLPAGRRYQPGGVALTSNIGDSTEFIGTRDYRPGDRIRDLHIRSWARVGYPVVRQYQEEFLTRVAMVMDTYVPPENIESFRIHKPKMSDAERSLEAGLSLASAIADYLAQQEYIVDFFAAGPELYRFRAGRSLAYLDNILETLACVEGHPQDPIDTLMPQLEGEFEQLSTMVVILLHWDEPRQKMIESFREHGLDAKTIVVSETVQQEDLAGSGAICLTADMIQQGVGEL